ncbi:MAG TPA: PDZ domain-containing protein, partial [Terriglobia bacterium]|nr:PDZ domain-containing protein [Terriglobia bacterium]
KKLNDAFELSSVVAELTPGKVVTLKYLRDGKEYATQLTIDDRAKIVPRQEGESTEEAEPESGTGTKLGITVQNLTPQQARDFEMQSDEGVIVSNVQVGSVADEAGLRPRDVIIQVNKIPIRSPEDLRGIAASLKSGSEVLFLIKRFDRERNDVGNLYLAATIP